MSEYVPRVDVRRIQDVIMTYEIDGETFGPIYDNDLTVDNTATNRRLLTESEQDELVGIEEGKIKNTSMINVFRRAGVAASIAVGAITPFYLWDSDDSLLRHAAETGGSIAAGIIAAIGIDVGGRMLETHRHNNNQRAMARIAILQSQSTYK